MATQEAVTVDQVKYRSLPSLHRVLTISLSAIDILQTQQPEQGSVFDRQKRYLTVKFLTGVFGSNLRQKLSHLGLVYSRIRISVYME
jgi:hypothetical protein